MKRVCILLILLCLSASCVPASTPFTPPVFAPTLIIIEPTLTSLSPTAILTPTVVPPTATPNPASCDPKRVDFCITQGHFFFQRPIKLPANTFVDVTYRYASTANGTRDPHHGVEFLNKFGTPVFAAGDGVVLFAGPDKKAIYSPWSNYYGNVVVLQHANALYTLYAHLSKILVEAGQTIQSGEEIGEVGQTGVATGSHLHFEVRRGDVGDYFSTENPELWLVPDRDETDRPLGVLQMTVRNQDGHLVKRAEYTIQYFDTRNQPTETIYYGVTYSADMLKGAENAGLGDLLPGKYRIALQYYGQHLERWVEVESGKLTQVLFVVN